MIATNGLRRIFKHLFIEELDLLFHEEARNRGQEMGDRFG